MPNESWPRALYVESTTRCNMRCAMCVKQSAGCGIVEADMPFALFRRLESALPRVEQLVLNGIGEPLLNRELTEMIAFARARMPGGGLIGFQSNGLMMTETLARRLVEAGLDAACFSVDSVRTLPGGALHGGEFLPAVERALLAVGQAAEATGRRVLTGVEFVLMRENLDELPEVIEWAAARGAAFVVVSQMLAYETQAEPLSAFNVNTPEATRLFEKWKDRGRCQGVDVHAYFDVAMKYAKSEAESRLMELVRDMFAEARAQGVSMNLRNLLRWDSGGLGAAGGLEGLFARAEETARAHGIRLALPGAHATTQGGCGFMEQSAAFVDVAGEVCPCHFLWHRYSCSLGGAAKQAWPVSFGNVGRDRLEDIWRGPEYVAFRTEALAREYPECSNCNVAPCSDMRCGDGPFVLDCLGSSVPCGHCPWALGMLKCLDLGEVGAHSS